VAAGTACGALWYGGLAPGLLVDGGGTRAVPYGASRLNDGLGAWHPARPINRMNEAAEHFMSKIPFRQNNTNLRRAVPYPVGGTAERSLRGR
jgi:hypothetical protein